MDIKKLFETYQIKPEEHPEMIVTANGNIYLNGKIDAADKSDEIYPGGVLIEDNAIETPKKGKK